jgi:catechol 2,3-dioxygenase-like lactoylglutathione lyase family enzyme
MTMIDHIGIGVTDYAKAKAFYDLALAPLGITKVMEVSAAETGHSDAAGYGKDRPIFWFNPAERVAPAHIAFTVQHRALVDAFHKAGVAAGGRDNGAPGPRPHYHANYYGAFVLDPDGHNIEAVCHAPV